MVLIKFVLTKHKWKHGGRNVQVTSKYIIFIYNRIQLIPSTHSVLSIAVASFLLSTQSNVSAVSIRVEE
jgi:hypothetical protein